MMTIEEILKDLSPRAQIGARIYLPILSRWIADAGWDTVREALYVQSAPAWYKAVRKRMTDAERDADDKRALAAVNALAIRKSEQIVCEQELLQSIVTTLISVLLAKL